MTLVRRTLLKYAVGSTVLTGLPRLAHASGAMIAAKSESSPKGDSKEYHDVDAGLVPAQARSVVVGWNQVLANAVTKGSYPPTISSRTMPILNTAMFNVWDYLGHAHARRFDTIFATPVTRQQGADPRFEQIALSSAAAAVLRTLFPASLEEIAAYGTRLGSNAGHPNAHVANRVGEEAAQHILNQRAHDGSNQLGDLNPGPYSDYTGYRPINSAAQMVDADRWQPLQHQACLTPQWGKVRPFALLSAGQFRPAPAPSIFSLAMYGEMQELIDLNANLTEQQMVVCRYWADGSRIPWLQFAQLLSYHQRHSVEQDVRLFRALGAALHDAMVATWDAKMAYDTARPISAIRTVFANRSLSNWGGYPTGFIEIPGSQWAPFLSTPPFPEYVSAHSTAGHAAVAVLERFTRGDFRIKQKFTATATLYWDSFAQAAEQAGYSRRLGGIHFKTGDLNGRELGRRIGKTVVKQFG